MTVRGPLKSLIARRPVAAIFSSISTDARGAGTAELSRGHLAPCPNQLSRRTGGPCSAGLKSLADLQRMEF